MNSSNLINIVIESGRVDNIVDIYLNEGNSDIPNVVIKAAEVVQKLMLSSVIVDKNIDSDVVKFLKKTCKGSYKLYRGIGLISSRVPKEHRKFVNSLKVGDLLPEFLMKKSLSNKYVSYTKKKSVAREFSEGRKSIIIQSNVSCKNVLVDLERYPALINKWIHGLKKLDLYDPEDVSYFKNVKEVIVIEPVESIIISIKGKNL